MAVDSNADMVALSWFSLVQKANPTPDRVAESSVDPAYGTESTSLAHSGPEHLPWIN